MNNLNIWQETVEIGKKPIVMQCRKLCIEHNGSYIVKKNNQQSSPMRTNSILPVDSKSVSSGSSSKSILPVCIMKTLSETEIANLNNMMYDTVIIFKEKDLEREENKTKILSTHYNFCVEFDMDKIINELLASYSTKKNGVYIYPETKLNIIDQIKLDFPRMEIYFNSIKCNTINQFNNHIMKFNNYSHDVMESIYYLLIMFCTQASFYYPFSIIHNIYTFHDSGIHVTPAKDYPCINIVAYSTSIEIIFKKTFQYTNINTSEIITKFYTFMVITINLMESPNGYFFSGKKYGECKSGILYWVKENNLLVI